MGACDCCFPCCMYSAFFGIFFYVAMGLIILLQNNFIRFAPDDINTSGIACFITALFQLFIFGSMRFYEYKKTKSSISRPEYLDIDESARRDRPRASSIKGIAMVQLHSIKREETEEHHEMLARQSI